MFYVIFLGVFNYFFLMLGEEVYLDFRIRGFRDKIFKINSKVNFLGIVDFFSLVKIVFYVFVVWFLF